MVDARLFIAQGPGDIQGPFRIDELRELWDAGALKPDAMYWHRGALGWRLVTEFRPPTRSELVVVPRVSRLSQIAGETIEADLGVVHTECVQGSNWGADMLAGVRDVVGGRATSLEKLLNAAVNTCLRGLEDAGKALGADAVVSASFEVTEVSGKGTLMLAVVATGTAVRLRDRPPPFLSR